MARNEQLIRQHRILQLLEGSRFGKTLEEIRDDLVDDLGLSSLHERTVRRDIEALQVAGYDIITETIARGKIWKLGRNDRSIHKISVTATELIALSIGRDLLYPLVGTSYWQGIESFWNKVREALPEGVFEHYQKYRKTLCVFGTPSKKYQAKEGILRTINRGIHEHRVIEVQYQSIGKPKATRRIEPYGLAVYMSSIYVVAAAEEITDPQERLRHWKLDRFDRATLTDEYFQVDPSVNLESHLGKSIGIFSGDQAELVKIRLGERAASWLREDPWHPEQTLEDDGENRFLLTVPATHPRELLPKVLALGADAEVIQPESFRSAIAEAVQALAATYAVQSGDTTASLPNAGHR